MYPRIKLPKREQLAYPASCSDPSTLHLMHLMPLMPFPSIHCRCSYLLAFISRFPTAAIPNTTERQGYRYMSERNDSCRVLSDDFWHNCSWEWITNQQSSIEQAADRILRLPQFKTRDANFLSSNWARQFKTVTTSLVHFSPYKIIKDNQSFYRGDLGRISIRDECGIVSSSIARTRP
ncbi:hypothetical protein L211DRAFT_398326 [Terfezia boudieri ATCC MYA-4762]|uniref:Uncharacterized protein n=1 Tax=Terfezia boudieri ATCC MYA-4762 TaxID=1051890 RepID=A0A3N4M0B4_9PEZI|nr:hypothetical protein L211DRAFT_398326 [Terfezia boudieri ATCC MYA-4762]